MSLAEHVSPLTTRTSREARRATLLRAFLASGLTYMLIPGTLLGVLNLIEASGRQSIALVTPAWIQAHGHAQVFGWVGSFILGIGLYSVPTVHTRSHQLAAGWIVWALWTAGVAGRWIANVYAWQWRLLLPLSGLAGLAAFLIFLGLVSGHRREENPGAMRPSGFWIGVVLAGTAGWTVALVLNFVTAISLAVHAASPTVPHALDQRTLTLLTWGALAPFIWGFSARWMPVLLGLPPLRVWALMGAVATSGAGIAMTFAAHEEVGAALFVTAAVFAIGGLRLFERPTAEARTRGVSASFPLFIRVAYGWLVIAAVLGLAASRWDTAGGLWGASRHAFTVGFTAAMVLAVGQRMLPGFAGHTQLWSTRLMGVTLTLLMLGCALRASCEVVAYERNAAWAWSVLPVSGIVELGAISAFALNLSWTLWG